MSVLVDALNSSKKLEINCRSPYRSPNQSCYLDLSYSMDDGASWTSTSILWTVHTWTSFLEMLEKFPFEKYDGYFSHYEETFEWHWVQEEASDRYSIFIFLKGMNSTFKAAPQQLHELAAGLKRDWKLARKAAMPAEKPRSS
ncbi:hypothetical protein HGI30_21945 [Paenibacillus albicereus]|uniref:Uncharacterized protein n=1 Tax=Paenibacillus albicereus TaxID=2726185 RepID=A0A6H2H2K1_9BACL|nr:hypothetical protein [Paenibacillus albicereus]QJC53924.1 hypothetical protein HGI30_21945 [Paenibacillus albicereus]